MNFFDIAKNMESQAIKTYTRLSVEAPLDQLKGVFKVLAAEEQRHYDFFESLQNKSLEVPADENILSRSKALLSKWDRDFKAPVLSDLSTAYKKCMQTEQEAVDFYTKEMEKLENDKQKKVIDIIINQEKRHVVLFENLIEFVLKPGQWLENAEFNHLDEY
jgi:rubrerythrin